MPNSSPRAGCGILALFGAVTGGAIGGLIPIAGFIYLAVTDPNGDIGSPLVFPIAIIFLSAIGLAVGSFIGIVIGLIRLLLTKPQNEEGPPIAKP